MRTLLIIIILLIVAGGGYYLYSQNSTSMDDADMTNPFGDSDTSTNTDTNTTNTNSAATTSGANVDVSVSMSAPKEITVTSTGMAFNQKTLTVKKGDRVKVTFTNGGGTHDLRIDGYNVGTNVINGGQSETFEFVANKTGSFEYYCSVSNHRAQGMKGTLTVTQ